MWRFIPRVRCVYHLAAAVGFKLVMEQTAQALKTNVIGACAVGGRRLLLVSSSAVYGKSDLEVCSEADDVVYGSASKLSWSYGAGKLVGRSTVRFLPYVDVYGEGFEDVLYRVPNLAKIEALGYHPTTLLKEILALTIEYRRRQGVTA